ncbi:MAG: lipid-A-disaccharide synthase [Rhodobacteraceae bacterium]|nr:lipid-A-disaccharide synthase [Paracoccaceae bacterium]
MRVFVLAGEPSGDRLGGAMMQGLRQLHPDITFDGIGGPMMAEQGLVSLFPMDELSIMGIAEVLPKYRHLKRRIAQTAKAVIDVGADVLITIDSPDFSLRVAKLVKAASTIRTVHYVAPTVWAWRPGRAAKMARMIDHVLALFPFEPALMQAAGMECDFVGHPVVAEPQATEAEIAAFRTAFDLGDAPVLLALPGSRRSEVTRLAPVFGKALQQVTQQHSDLRIVVPAAASLADLVVQKTADWPANVVIIDPNALDNSTAQAHKRAAFRTANVALAASGTVSLELAAAQTPMVIAYKFNWLSWQIISRLLLIDTGTLVNLVSETRVVPECLGPECTPDLIAQRLAEVLSAPDQQNDAMALTMKRLGQGGKAPGLRAAQAVLDRL